jgi:glutamate racemase
MQDAAKRAGTLVVACNTASVRLEEAPDLLVSAAEARLRVLSMVQLLDRALALAGPYIRGKRVCLMGTRFTVNQPVYRDRLLSAGAAEVLPLAATRTERNIAHLWHDTEDGRREIEAEVGATLRRSEAVVLACTLFPLIAPLLRRINPAGTLVDPAAGVDAELLGITGSGPNHLRIAVTGDAIALDDVRDRSGVLFPGWRVDSVEKAAIGKS